MPPLHQHPHTLTASRTGTPAGPPARPRRARRTGAAAFAALTVLAVGGCGGGSSSSPSADTPSDGGSATASMATAVSMGKVAGAFHQPNRQRFHNQAPRLRAEVGKAVDAWFDGGFVGVDYPTTDFPDAFTTFTVQAKSDALRQKNLMTAGQLGGHIDGVTTVKRTVALDVLAPRGRPAGVTARFVLRFRTTGDTTRTVTVSGRLFLTRSPAGAWQIFGYDVAKGAK